MGQPLINLAHFILISPPWFGIMPSFDVHRSFTYYWIGYDKKTIREIIIKIVLDFKVVKSRDNDDFNVDDAI